MVAEQARAEERTWDVLIVAGPGLATDLAYALHGQLTRRDVRVELDMASRPSASPRVAGERGGPFTTAGSKATLELSRGVPT